MPRQLIKYGKISEINSPKRMRLQSIKFRNQSRLPSPLLSKKSPYEMLYHHPSSFTHLKVFGCLCYAIIVQPTHKFESRAKHYVFVGYPTGQKGYKLNDLEKKIISLDVKFYEDAFLISSILHIHNSQTMMSPFSIDTTLPNC